MISGGSYKLSNLFDGTTHYVDFSEQDLFFNINTPQDWAQIRG
jgi:molybdopterin-guanine dinucleotide biosynthesis protein A